MNIIEFAESLQARMKQQIENLDADQDDMNRIGGAMTYVRELICELKIFTRNYKFTNQAEEIEFFKEIKPVFLSQYFYYKKILAIGLFDSFKDLKNRQANYSRLLKKLQRFAEKNKEFYEYCMTNATYLDKQYFTRRSEHSRYIDIDEKFSTGYDKKLAKILTNELTKKYLLKALRRSQVNNENEINRNLVWTGSKTDLTELIYALHAVDVFNKGSADIGQIAKTFECLFNVKLGNYYRTFQEIRMRKNGVTNFLDALRGKLLNRIQEFNR